MINLAPTDAQTGKILIVDDNEGNRLLFSAQLRMENYHTIWASNGADAILLAQEQNPDLILLDVMMPKIDGFEVCRRLKQDSRSQLIPIIMVSALRDVHYRIEGIAAGADEFLSRPYVREELIVRVRTLIRLKQIRVRLQEERNRLKLLYDVSHSINRHLDLDTMMREITSQMQAAIGAEKGNLMLFDEAGSVERRFIVRGDSKIEISRTITEEILAKGLAGWLIRHNRGEIIPDVQADSRWLILPESDIDVGSVIGVPLSRANRTVGVLILNHSVPGYFKQEQLVLLETMCAQITTAIENSYLFTEVNEERGKLDAILSQSAEAIITCDAELRISKFNQAAEHLFGLKADEIVDCFVTEIQSLHPLLELVSKMGHESVTEEISLDDGRILHAGISRIAGVGYAAVLHDLTERKNIEAMRLERERSEKQKVKELFSRYMGPQLVDHVLSYEPGLMARRERRHAVVMYADLRNSTQGLITKMDPHEAVNCLNEFFTAMMDIALENQGTVFELTGDEILVGFNAPFDQPNAALLALNTAVMMQLRFNHLFEQWYRTIQVEVGLGIGIDQGEVVVGNVGAESRMNFRMVGEVMSRAHRLVEMASDGEIVFSQAIQSALLDLSPQIQERSDFQSFGPISLKGFEEAQTVYMIHVDRPALESKAKNMV